MRVCNCTLPSIRPGACKDCINNRVEYTFRRPNVDWFQKWQKWNEVKPKEKVTEEFDEYDV